MLDDIAFGILDGVVSAVVRPLSICNIITSAANGAACAHPELYSVIPYTSAAQASTAAITIAKRAYDQKSDNPKKLGLNVEIAITTVQHIVGFSAGYLIGYVTRQ